MNPTNLSHHERAVLLRAAEQVESACERAWIAAMNDKPEPFKVQAGIYRVGAYTIQKGHRWCCYLDSELLPVNRSRTLQEAIWWAQHNQPKESA